MTLGFPGEGPTLSSRRDAFVAVDFLHLLPVWVMPVSVCPVLCLLSRCWFVCLCPVWGVAMAP